MLIQSASSAAVMARPTSDSVPAPVVASGSGAAPVEVSHAVQPAETKKAAEQNAKAAGQNGSEPTSGQVQRAVDNLNKAMQKVNPNVEFSVDRDTKQTVIKVVESKTGDVIRQFPSEDVLAISRAIDQMQKQGVLLKQKA